MKKEKKFNGVQGWVILILFAVLAALPAMVYQQSIILAVISGFLAFLILPGFVVVNPNEAVVLVFFGTYSGTITENGFKWVNPFMAKKKISLRARNFDSPPVKVNDKMGNPIMIGSVLVWKVEDTYAASFEVDHYEQFVKIQSEAAIRKLAGSYSYDNLDHEGEVSLRSGGAEVNHELERELTERLLIAGIKVLEARISSLSYASEIAGAMLQRQQAIAMVAARQKIVEGAVGMVETALHQLNSKNLFEMDDERKAAMVSNLLVVLCSERSASPVVNAGTLHH